MVTVLDYCYQDKPMNTGMLGKHMKTSILRAGFEAVQLSHRSYRSGFETRFVIARAIENGGRFDQQHVEQPKRLGGWSEK
ncbi:uncharacterized protein LOC144659985 isoform X2 [Oculina patagonica]